MRSLELALAVVVAAAVLSPAGLGVRPRRGLLAVALVATLTAHLVLEGFRWQMLPLYLASGGLALGDVFFIDRGLAWSSRLLRGALGSLGVALAVLVPLALPVPRLPAPSGPHAIGTISVEVDARDRLEMFGPDAESATRRLMAQIWYPAVPDSGGEPGAWTEDWDVVAPAAASSLGLPSWFFDHTRYTLSDGMPDAEIAPGVFPVVIFSHGWTGFRTIAINQAETLASNGYIVVAIDHTYGSVVTRFGDGTVVYNDPSALPDPEVVGEEAYNDAASKVVATFAEDIVSIMDELEMGSEGAFAAVTPGADLTRLGVYGHSTGGGAAVHACLVDSRCDAVLGLDPWVENLPDRVLRIEPATPSLFMRSDEWRGTRNDSILLGIAGRNTEVTYVVGVEGAHHGDFIVAPLLSPFGSRLGVRGPIPAGRVISIVDNYLVGFFDVFLLGTGSAALDTVAFEEVTIETFNR